MCRLVHINVHCTIFYYLWSAQTFSKKKEYKCWLYFDPFSKTNRLPCLFSAFDTLSLYFFLIAAKGFFKWSNPCLSDSHICNIFCCIFLYSDFVILLIFRLIYSHHSAENELLDRFGSNLNWETRYNHENVLS